MNKVLFFISVIALAACSTYTVKNEMAEGVKVGGKDVAANGCVEFSDELFGLSSDFPVKITKADDKTAISDKVSADREFEAGNWVIKADGSVEESETACKMENNGEGDGNADKKPAETTEAPANTEVKMTAETCAAKGENWMFTESGECVEKK